MADYGQNYYDSQYQDYDAIYNSAKLAAPQAQFYANEAAKVADPYGYKRRTRAANKFDALLENPGDINSSPVYKYLMKQQLRPVQAYNAAHGLSNSGRGMLALGKAAKEASTEAFFPLLTAYGKASGAFNPLSPGAAALSLRGSDRSQDYDQIAAAARAAGKSAPPSSGVPPWMQGAQSDYARMLSPGATGLPSGSATPYAGYSGPAYTPSSGAGTGYMTSDYGATVFGDGGGAYAPTSMYATTGYPSYDYSDFGGGDYGYDYGGDY